jgi:hypothetical protein
MANPMVRTLISLDPKLKAWLDRQAKRQGIPMAELVRRALERYRAEGDGKERDPKRRALHAVRGTWRGPEPLDYQRSVREEWERR